MVYERSPIVTVTFYQFTLIVIYNITILLRYTARHTVTRSQLQPPPAPNARRAPLGLLSPEMLSVSRRRSGLYFTVYVRRYYSFSFTVSFTCYYRYTRCR